MFGFGTIHTTVNQSASVPPFPLDAADNGLSVDPTSRKIVLGNDVGDASEPAQLLSNRLIQMMGFSLFLGDPTALTFGQISTGPWGFKFGTTDGLQFTQMQASELVANSQEPGQEPKLIVNGDTGSGQIAMIQGSAIMKIFDGVLVDLARFDFANLQVQVGDVNGQGNGTVVSVTDSNGSLELNNTAGNAKYSIDGSDGVNGTFTTVDLKTVTVKGGLIVSIV
jgi:hypothetical protein